MIRVQEITLDVYDAPSFSYVNAKQDDNISRQLVITLTDNGTPIKPDSKTEQAVFRVLKPDGHSVLDQAIIGEDGRITVALSDQALACPGQAEADVAILKGEEVISSAIFFIQVARSPLGTHLTSENEFLLLVDATRAAEQAAKKADTAAGGANEAAEKANNAAEAANDEATHPGRIIDGTWNYWDREKGEYVDTGIDGTVSLRIAEVITGEPGTKAKVENIGTDTDIKLKITIPRGEPGGVTAIKGNAETSYRNGEVNLTPADIGLGNVPNVSTNDQTPTFTQAGSRVNIASGDKLSTLFGKIAKWFADLKAVAFSGKYSDLTGTPGAASQSAAGLMSATDKKKLDGIAAGAQVNAVTSVNKKTGAVTLTPADIGALPTAYTRVLEANKSDLTDRDGTAFFDVRTNVVEGHEGEDLAMLQVNSGFDAYQLTASGQHLMVRQNDDPTNPSGWGAFSKVMNQGDAAAKVAHKLTFTGGVTGNWDGSADKSVAIPAAATAAPKAPGTAAVGTGTTWARADHVHPVQTSVTGSSGSCTGNAASATKVGHKLTFTGSVTGDWDGSAAKSVRIPGALGDLSNGVWSAGDSIDYDSILLNGYITNSGKNVVLLFSLGRLIKGGVTAKVTKLNGVLRGVDGYVGGSSSFNLLSGATVSVVQHADIGQVQITVSKSAAFSDAVNNTPVAFVGAVTVSFAASSDEPMPGPEIFGDETAQEGPSMEDGAEQPESDETPEKEVEAV